MQSYGFALAAKNIMVPTNDDGSGEDMNFLETIALRWARNEQSTIAGWAWFTYGDV